MRRSFDHIVQERIGKFDHVVQERVGKFDHVVHSIFCARLHTNGNNLKGSVPWSTKENYNNMWNYANMKHVKCNNLFKPIVSINRSGLLRNLFLWFDFDLCFDFDLNMFVFIDWCEYELYFDTPLVCMMNCFTIWGRLVRRPSLITLLHCTANSYSKFILTPT